MKRSILIAVCLSLVALFVAAPSGARADNAAVFSKANGDYAAGHFSEAIKGYQTLVDAGQWSATLFYDLGNAWFRAGDLGQAILNYERALALEPHHPEAHANLQLVRDEARALELRQPPLGRYLAIATETQYSIIAAISFWVMFFGMTHLLFSQRHSRTRVALMAFSLLVFAGACFAVYSLETEPKGKSLAIVIGKKIEARLATAENANSVLVLPPGSELNILSKRGDWIYTALPNDLRGWIPADSAELVRLEQRGPL
jgi:tetratricopeptide (TPR) repeat protein